MTTEVHSAKTIPNIVHYLTPYEKVTDAMANFIPAQDSEQDSL